MLCTKGNNYLMVLTAEIIESYKCFLEVKYPTHYKSYCTRLKNKPESAKAEAVTFSILRSYPQSQVKFQSKSQTFFHSCKTKNIRTYLLPS